MERRGKEGGLRTLVSEFAGVGAGTGDGEAG